MTQPGPAGQRARGGLLSWLQRSRPVATPNPLVGRRWVLVDVETSGLRPYAHRILSIAALAFDENGLPDGEFATLLNPGCDPGPIHIHGLTRARLAGQPVFQDVLPALLNICRNRVLVAHNAGFDHDFLEHEAVRVGASFAVRERLCTLALSRRLGLPVPDHRLPTLAAHFDIRQVRHHDAVDDVRVLAKVFHRSAGLAAELGLPLPIVDCTRRPRPQPFPPAVVKTACQFRYPGAWHPGTPLVQGMKVAVTGPTDDARERLIQRFVDAGLDVTTAVSSVTNVLVANDTTIGTRKLEQARRHGTPIVTESTMLVLLDRLRPGERKDAPKAPSTRKAPPAPKAQRAPKPIGPFSRRRVLTLGGPHETAAQVRARVAEMGGAASVNLTATVTDVVLLSGADNDSRWAKARDRSLTVLSWPELVPARWPDPVGPDVIVSPPSPVPVEGSVRVEETVPAQQPEPRAVLIRGQAMDLPDDQVWSLNVSWQAAAESPACDVDVVAFIVDQNERVTTDADFVFYNQPISEDGAIQLAENGSCEQGVRVDLAALPTWCTRVEVAAAITGEGTFGELGAIVLDADAGDDVSGTARPVATATLDAATTERTMLIASVYRRGGGWRLRAIGQGYDTGLAALATSFGVEVDES